MTNINYIGITPQWKEKNLKEFEFENDQQERIFKTILEKPTRLNIFSNDELKEALKVFYYNDVVSIFKNYNNNTILNYHQILAFLIMVDESIKTKYEQALKFDGYQSIDQLILYF